MKITITKDSEQNNYYTVEQDGKISDGLTWDEMIGQVAYITCPKGHGWTNDDHLFRMHEPEQATA